MSLFGRRAPETGVVGSFSHLDLLIAAVEKAKAEDALEIREVFSPTPIDELQELLYPSKSPVRFLTLSGALFGVVGGFALAILTSLVWNIYVGGKPITNHVPFVVVGFEMLILFGAIATFLAIIIFSGLPYRRFPGPAYQPSFSKNTFGLWVSHADSEKARAFLESAGAVAVTAVDSGEGGGK